MVGYGVHLGQEEIKPTSELQGGSKEKVMEVGVGRTLPTNLPMDLWKLEGKRCLFWP